MQVIILLLQSSEVSETYSSHHSDASEAFDLNKSWIFELITLQIHDEYSP
jgi:hypothetical protein